MSRPSRFPPCPGIGKDPARIVRAARLYRETYPKLESAGQGECPTCGRVICYYATNRRGMVYHRTNVEPLEPRQRQMDRSRRARSVQDSMRWEPSGSMVIALRWWFRDYGGAAAFNDLRRGTSSPRQSGDGQVSPRRDPAGPPVALSSS